MRYRTEVAALPSTCNIVAVQRFEGGRLVFALSDRYRVIDLGMGKSPVLVLQATPCPYAKCGSKRALSAELIQTPHMYALDQTHHDAHRHHVRAAIRDKWERQPAYRGQTHCHSDVLKHLERHQRKNSTRYI